MMSKNYTQFISLPVEAGEFLCLLAKNNVRKICKKLIKRKPKTLLRWSSIGMGQVKYIKVYLFRKLTLSVLVLES